MNWTRPQNGQSSTTMVEMCKLLVLQFDFTTWLRKYCMALDCCLMVWLLRGRPTVDRVARSRVLQRTALMQNGSPSVEYLSVVVEWSSKALDVMICGVKEVKLGIWEKKKSDMVVELL